MFETVNAKVASAVLPAGVNRQQLAGMVQHVTHQLASLGANVTVAASGNPASAAAAVALIRAQVNGQSFASQEAKQIALGRLDQLAGLFTSLGI